MSWSPQENPADASCKRGGFVSVDISNPAQPVQKAFVPALPETYHGEGAHAISRRHARRSRATSSPSTTSPAGPTASAASTSTTSATRPTRRRSIQGAGDRSPDDASLRPGSDRGAATPPQRLRLAGRPARVRGHRRQHRAARRRHLRHHRADEPGVHRRPRPRRAVPEHRRRERQRRRDLPPRRGRQEHRRRADDAGLLLGRGLRQAQRQRSGPPAVPRRHELRRAGPAARASTRRRATATRPSSPHDNRFVLAADEDFSPYRAGRVLDHDRPERRRVPAAGGERRTSVAAPARPHAQRPGRLRRLRLRRVGAGPAALVGEPRHARGGRGGDPRPAARPDGRSVRDRGGVLPGREGRQRRRGGLGRRAARQPPSRRRRERRSRTAARAATRPARRS